MKIIRLKNNVYKFLYLLTALLTVSGCSTFDEKAAIYLNNSNQAEILASHSIYADPKKYLFNSQNKLPGNLVITNIKGLSDKQKVEVASSVVEHAEKIGISIVPTQYADLYANYNPNQHYLTAEFNYAPGIDSSVFYYVWSIYDPQGNKVHSIKDEVTVNSNPEKRSEFIFPRNVLAKLAINTAQKLSVWWARYTSAYPDRATPPAFLAMQPHLVQPHVVSQQQARQQQVAQQQYASPYNPYQTAPQNTYQEYPNPVSTNQANHQNLVSRNQRLPQSATNQISQQQQNTPTPAIQSKKPIVTHSINQYNNRILNNTQSTSPIVFITNSIKGLDAQKTAIILKNLKTALNKNNIVVTQSLNNTNYIITAEVKLASLNNTNNSVEINWHLQESSGNKIGVVTQKNTMNNHDFYAKWNEISKAATQAATIKMIEFLKY